MNKRIAITIDDAPLGNGAQLTGLERTNLIIETLADKNVEATIFVTPRDFSENNSFERVSAYDDAGHLIANHSNTHPSLSEVGLRSFLAEIDETTALLEDFDNYRPWFRFPFLDEGNRRSLRDDMRDALDDRGIQNGFVTVTPQDWYYDQRLAEAISAGDTYNLDAVGSVFVDAIVELSNYYDALALDTIGRSPVHSLLLHENDITALFLDDIIDALRADGWEIVSSDETYSDPLADMEARTLSAGSGVIAALNYDQNGDPSVFQQEAATREGIDERLDAANAFGSSPIINGTSGDDYIIGTNGNDAIYGLGGEDVVQGSGGYDVVSLSENEYGQVDYEGLARDYEFTRLDTGDIRVNKPDGSFDFLSGVDGFWFFGEERWYNAEDLAPKTLVTGITDGDDVITGTSGDDDIVGLGGEDVVLGSAGNDTIRLGDGYDQVDYSGASSDYVMVRNADNSVTVTKPDGGVDTLTGVDGFWFNGEQAWYSVDQLAPPSAVSGITNGDDYILGTDGNDVIDGLGGEDVVRGTAGNDTIILGDGYDQVDYVGSASDYTMTRNPDGTVEVTKPDGSFDVLSGVDGFWFLDEEAWYGIDQLTEASPQAVMGDVAADALG